MMGLTDRVEPWARRFQRPAAAAERPATQSEPVRASLRPLGEDEVETPERRTGRFTRRVLQEQER